MLWVLGGAHVKLKAGIVDSALVLHAFLCTRAKATCHQEGPMRAPDGLDEPPDMGDRGGGGCKVQRRRRKGLRRGLASPRRGGLEGVN